jgi:hypothetical protein
VLTLKGRILKKMFELTNKLKRRNIMKGGRYMRKNSNRMVRGLLIAALLVVGLVVAGPAYANTIFDLTSDHCTGGCGTPPFGTVTLAQNGSTVDVTVDLADGYAFAKTGAADFQAFKFNGTAIVLGDVTVDQTVLGQTLAATTGALNGDGTGNFLFGIECSTCGNGGSDAFSDNIVFHVADATIADLTVPNNLGNVFVADVLAPNGNTGPVDATTPRNGVPEPASLMLLGAGLAAIGIWRRKSGQI